MFKTTILFLTFIVFSLAAYDESIARNKMFPLISAAYSDNPSLCLANAFSNAQLQRQITVSCGDTEDDTCSGFTAVSQSDQAIIISFRGTEAFLQLVSEGVGTIFKSKVTSAIGGQVSEYFYNGFIQIWNAGMKNDFVTLKNQYPGYKIWVTGHSLGGAMASICASTIVGTKLAPANNVYLYTFGQPRTGDKTFSNNHDALNLATSNRITHAHDVVPHIPTENFEGYYHHKSELFYDNDMAKHLADESNKCSDGNLINLSVGDHLDYFNKMLMQYGKNGCVDSFAKSKIAVTEEKVQKV